MKRSKDDEDFGGRRIAVQLARQILVARKRNDEYALNIKVSRRVTVCTNRRAALTDSNYKNGRLRSL
jgi:hypothetical protein